MILGLYLAATMPNASAVSSTEPLLFEYVGDVVSGLSYVHSVIPVDLAGFEKQLMEYQLTLEREFDSATLERTHRDFVNRVKVGTKVNKTTDSLNFDRSMLAKWKEIGDAHIEEIKKLNEQARILREAVPPLQHDDGPNERFAVPAPANDPWNTDFARRVHEEAPKINPITRRPRTRTRRHPAALIAVGVAAAGGTAFGIYNTVQIEDIKKSIDNLEKRFIAFEQVFGEVAKDLIELQDEVHGILMKQLMDNAFDTGLLVARLRSQYTLFADRLRRYIDVMQQAQHRRLAMGYLDDVTLRKIFTQAQYRARQVNCVLVIRQPSDLFQLEMSYSYDGRKVFLMLHIPISPAESTMRLYRLHTFPLPFDNDTFLIPDVNQHLLGISNTNTRYTVQYSLADFQGCHKMGRIYLCERNGLFYKYPEDTCLGALYHQKYDQARELCSFHLEPAREYVRQLKDNWYLVYSEAALTVPMLCANQSYSELHIRPGASKFHLSAGCTADLPRHRLVSDLSVLIPQDYIQFDMEWDPASFLPNIRDYIIPEFNRLQRYGATRVALSQVQANVASSLEQPQWYHNFHFSGNSVALITAIVGLLIAAYMCVQSRRRRAKERRGRRIEEAVRTALNGSTPRGQLALPMPMPMPMSMPMTAPMSVVSHVPPSTVYAQPPMNPHHESYEMMTRPNSYTNLTSVSEAASRRTLPERVQYSTLVHPSCPSLVPDGGLPAYQKTFDN